MARSDNKDNNDHDIDVLLRDELASPEAPAPRDTLKRDILADFDAQQRETRHVLRFGFDWRALLQRTALAQSGALAGVGALGLAIGANLTATAGYAEPEDEFYALNETVSVYAALEDEEFAPWATE